MVVSVLEGAVLQESDAVHDLLALVANTHL
jgi:hypothetical protein